MGFVFAGPLPLPKPFDATLKNLVRNHPADWLRHLGVPFTDPPTVLDTDLSAVSAADTLVRVGERVVHIDLEAGPDEGLATRMLLYNVLAHRQTGLPVWSVAVLLRSNAVRANLRDRVEYDGLSFRFEVVRVWEEPAERFLTAGVGLMPLAGLARPPAGMTREQALPEQVERMAGGPKSGRKARPPTWCSRRSFWPGCTCRRGGRGPSSRGFFRCANPRRTSGVLEQGAVEHSRKLLMTLRRAMFGAATPEQANKLKAIQDLDRLDRPAVRVLRVDSWDALLRGR